MKILAILAMLLPSLAQANPYDTLVTSLGATYYWPFSSSSGVRDIISGSDAMCYNGTCTYGAPIATYVTGMYVSSSSTTSVSSTVYAGVSGNFSITAWVELSSAASQVPLGWSEIGANSLYLTNAYALCSPSTNIGWGNYYTTLQWQSCPSSSLTDGTVHMVGISCAGTTCTLYDNGASYATKTVSSFSGFGNFMAFGNYASGGYQAIGYVGGVAAYQNVALSGAQMLQLYNCGLSGTGCPGSGSASGQLLFLN